MQFSVLNIRKKKGKEKEKLDKFTARYLQK